MCVFPIEYARSLLFKSHQMSHGTALNFCFAKIKALPMQDDPIRTCGGNDVAGV
jgi:hypothetical protein